MEKEKMTSEKLLNLIAKAKEENPNYTDITIGSERINEIFHADDLMAYLTSVHGCIYVGGLRLHGSIGSDIIKFEEKRETTDEIEELKKECKRLMFLLTVKDNKIITLESELKSKNSEIENLQQMVLKSAYIPSTVSYSKQKDIDDKLELANNIIELKKELAEVIQKNISNNGQEEYYKKTIISLTERVQALEFKNNTRNDNSFKPELPISGTPLVRHIPYFSKEERERRLIEVLMNNPGKVKKTDTKPSEAKSEGDSKYYTPSIEEFHIGFIYEWNNNNEDGVWRSSVADLESCYHCVEDIQQNLDYNKYRIKFLDASGIESIGLKQTTKNVFANNEIELQMFDNNIIEITRYYPHSEHLFLGTIKNISELKEELIRLGIN